MTTSVTSDPITISSHSSVTRSKRIEPDHDDEGAIYTTSRSNRSTVTYRSTNHVEVPNTPIDWAEARDITLTGLSSEKITLQEICSKGRTVLVFLRRFTCVTCFTYIALFAHLQPAIQSSQLRIMFITCHEHLQEVQLFLRLYAIWLRDLGKKGGYETEGVLPGEIYLDPERKSYQFFGLKEEMYTSQLIRVVAKNWWKDLWGYGHKNRATVKREKPKSRAGLLDEVRHFVRNEIVSLIPKGNSKVVRQSPGIVVVDGDKVVYKFVVKDQDTPIPDGDDRLAEALQCNIQHVHDIDAEVMEKMDDFMDLIANRNVTANVPTNEIVYVKKIGGGIESEVYMGKWMGMTVAVKVFQTLQSNTVDPDSEKAEANFNESIKSFANEAALLMSLRHKNIITMMGFGCQRPEKNFLVAEYMPRGSLFDVIGKANKLTNALSKEDKRRILIDIASGMHFLHTCRPCIIHQDLKSLNVLVADDLTCKIADFGIAKEIKGNKSKLFPFRQTASADDGHADESDDKSTHGGTVHWMPPELMTESPPPATTKTDTFAFGVIMWELATLKRPWRNTSLEAVCNYVVNGKRPEIPYGEWHPKFTQLVEFCWSQFPQDRPEFKVCLSKLKVLEIPGTE